MGVQLEPPEPVSPCEIEDTINNMKAFTNYFFAGKSASGKG